MTQLRNIDAELQRFRHRIFVFTVVVAVCFLLLFRVVLLQFHLHVVELQSHRL